MSLLNIWKGDIGRTKLVKRYFSITWNSLFGAKIHYTICKPNLRAKLQNLQLQNLQKCIKSTM